MAANTQLYSQGIIGNLPNIIEITTAIPADQPEWDSFVLSHPEASPYHLIAWGAAIRQAYGHKHYYLMARKKAASVGYSAAGALKLYFS